MNYRCISFYLSLFCFPISFLAFVNILYASYFDYFLSLDAYVTTLVISILFGLVFFFGLLLVYPFNVISISAIIYLSMLPISFFHYRNLKKQNEDQNLKDDEEDLEDIL